jgi:hypothetical protein
MVSLDDIPAEAEITKGATYFTPRLSMADFFPQRSGFAVRPSSAASENSRDP